MIVAAGSLAAAAAGIGLRAAIAAKFGASAETDALVAALQSVEVFTTPLVGMLGTAFIPTLARLLDTDPNRGWGLARTVVIYCTWGFALLALILALASAPLAAWVVGDGDPARAALATRFVPWFAAAGIAAAWVGVLTGVLQVRHNYWLPALAQPTRALAATAIVLLGAGTMGIWAAAAGQVAGVVLQALVVGLAVVPLLVGRRGAGRHDPAVRAVGRLMLPLLVGSFVWQGNHLVSTFWAARSGIGAITEYNYAAGIAGVIASLVGGSLADAAFPRLARAAGEGSRALASAITTMLHVSVYGAAIASALLVACGPDAIRVLFGHGTFSDASVARTGEALQVFGIGLTALVAPTVLSRAFYATGDAMWPQVLTLPAVAVNAVLASQLAGRLALPGVAVATLVSQALFGVCLLVVLRRRAHALSARPLAAIGARAALAALVVYVAAHGTGLWFSSTGWAGAAVRLIASVVAGGAAAVLVTLLLDEFGVRRLLATWRTQGGPPS